MKEILERISVLEESGFVTRGEARDLRGVAKALSEDVAFRGIKPDFAPFVMHLAAAFRRRRLGERIEPPDISLEADMRTHGVYDEARLVFERIKGSADIDFEESERRFLLGHIGALLASAGCGYGSVRRKEGSS